MLAQGDKGVCVTYSSYMQQLEICASCRRFQCTMEFSLERAYDFLITNFSLFFILSKCLQPVLLVPIFFMARREQIVTTASHVFNFGFPDGSDLGAADQLMSTSKRIENCCNTLVRNVATNSVVFLTSKIVSTLLRCTHVQIRNMCCFSTSSAPGSPVGWRP